MYGDQSVLVYDFLSAFALVPGQVLYRFTGLPYKGSKFTFKPKGCSLEGRLFGGITAGSSASVRLVVTVTSVVVVSFRFRVLLRFTCAGTLFRFGLLFSWFIFSRLFFGHGLILDWCILYWCGRVSVRHFNLCGYSSGLSDALVECVIVILSHLFK